MIRAHMLPDPVHHVVVCGVASNKAAFTSDCTRAIPRDRISTAHGSACLPRKQGGSAANLWETPSAFARGSRGCPERTITGVAPTASSL